jgi:hypothetical protein
MRDYLRDLSNKRVTEGPFRNIKADTLYNK